MMILILTIIKANLHSITVKRNATTNDEILIIKNVDDESDGSTLLRFNQSQQNCWKFQSETLNKVIPKIIEYNFWR